MKTDERKREADISGRGERENERKRESERGQRDGGGAREGEEERAREGWGESARGGERRRGRERESKRRAEISFMIERVLKKEKKNGVERMKRQVLPVSGNFDPNTFFSLLEPFAVNLVNPSGLAVTSPCKEA